MDAHWKLVQEMPFRVWSVPNAIFPSNCYICEIGTEGHCCIIDPGLDADVVSRAVAQVGLLPVAVFCTHGHFDHSGSAAHFQNSYDIPVYLHEADKKTLNACNFLLMAFKIPAKVALPRVTALSGDIATIEILGRQVVFHHAPGHSPGSCLIQIGATIFSGDTIYSKGVGLSKLPGENPAVLKTSILSVWDRFPADNMILPGHGGAATFGWIKDNNRELLHFVDRQILEVLK